MRENKTSLIKRREVHHDTRTGNGPAGQDPVFETVRIKCDKHGIPTVTIDSSAFSSPDLAVARQLIALGQLIEELALNPTGRRMP